MIGFKTEYMKRAERMPVLFEAESEKHNTESEIDNEELITAIMRQRIRKQAIGLIDAYLFGYGLQLATFAELEKLKQVVLTLSK